MNEKIDVEGILKSKAGNKRISPLIVKFLKRIVHQNEINVFLKSLPNGTNGLEFVAETLRYLNSRYEIIGSSELDKNKRYIFVSNHPLGGLDGVILGQALGSLCDGNIRILVNDLLMYLRPLQSIFIPVNKLGAQGKNNVDLVNSNFESDLQILTFPSGACSRFQWKERGIYDPVWKKTFISKAIQYERDIIPIYFEGKNSFFFYALSFIRQLLGIKLNIEMLFLSDEMFKNRHQTFRVHVGKPIPWQHFDKSKSQQEWAREVKGITYRLKNL